MASVPYFASYSARIWSRTSPARSFSRIVSRASSAVSQVHVDSRSRAQLPHMQRSELKIDRSASLSTRTVPVFPVLPGIVCACAAGVAASMIPNTTLAAVAAIPRAPAQTRDSPSSSCGHMQMKLPAMRITQPNQIQLTSGLMWIWNEARFLFDGLIVPTMRYTSSRKKCAMATSVVGESGCFL
jgi:hypothetical protein